jgi:hypothetical protein
MASAPIVRMFPGAGRIRAGTVYVQGGGGYLDGVECEFAVAIKTGPGSSDYEVAAYVLTEAHAVLFANALAAARKAGA